MSGAATWILWIWALSLAIVSGVAVVRRLRATPRRVDESPPLWLIRPCAGDEPGLLERLTTIGDWPRQPAVRLSVTQASDSAWPVIQAAASTLCAMGIDADARVIATTAPNRKAAQLMQWFDEAPADGVFINIDSDVDLRDFDGRGLIGALGDAAWTPPSEHAPTTFGDHASAAFLNASLHSFTVLGGLDPAGLVGKAFAVRVAQMRAAGGFAGLDHCLGEDMEIARRIRAQGGTIGLHPSVARAAPHGRRTADVIARYARWLAVIRAQRPALLLSYPLLFGATTPLVILSAIVGAWGPLAVALGARIGVALSAQRLNQRPWALLHLPRTLALGEYVTWAAFVRALRTRTVMWRGNALRIGPGGRLERVYQPERV